MAPAGEPVEPRRSRISAGLDRGTTPETASIDEGVFVAVGGVEQWVTLRGGDVRNPVLLLVSGPGVALSPMAPFFAPWEEDFTLVQWDQPGAGATFGRHGDAGTGALSIDRITRDGVAVAEFVHRRLPASRVILLGVSGGSLVGLRMAKQRPDIFSAYVGSGQIVNWARQEQLAYDLALADARAAGRQAAVDELERIGPPPYETVATDAILGKYAGALTPAEQAAFAAIDPAVAAQLKTPPEGARYIARGVTPSDPRARAASAFAKLRPDIRAFDASTLGPRYDIPMFFFQGDHDAYTVTSEVKAFVDVIQAPTKLFAPIEGGGHSCVFMRDAFLALLNRHVRPVV